MNKSQQGLSTLVFTLILLLAATWLTLTVAHSSRNEQRLFSADYQSQNRLAIDEAAQAYAMSWLRSHNGHWQQQANGDETAAPDTLPVFNANPAGYHVTIEYRRQSSAADIIEISSTTANHHQRHSISQTVRQQNGQLVFMAGSWRDF